MSISPPEPATPAGAARHKAPLGLRTVAIFEFVKGSLVLVVAMGLLSLIHRDVQAAAEHILHTLHLDPAWHYSRLFIEESARMTDTGLRRLAAFALLYTIIRYVETYGLWHERPWAEWFAVISASIYLPVEVYEFSQKPSLVRAVLFFVNLVIVVYLVWLLYLNHLKKKAQSRLPPPPP